MDAKKLRIKAQSHHSRGKFRQAQEAYGQLILLLPEDAQLRVRHAEVSRKGGDPFSALTSYRMAASLFRAEGRVVWARAAVRAGLELAPEDAELLAQREELGAQLPVPSADDESPEWADPSEVFEIGPPLKGTSSRVEVIRIQHPPRPAAELMPRIETIGRNFATPATQDDLPAIPPPVDVAPVPMVALTPEVRRISERVIAFRTDPAARWVVLTSETPIRTDFRDTLERLAG